MTAYYNSYGKPKPYHIMNTSASPTTSQTVSIFGEVVDVRVDVCSVNIFGEVCGPTMRHTVRKSYGPERKGRGGKIRRW